MSEEPMLSTLPLLSVAEVAERLSCSRDHVYDLLAAGEIPSIDIGLKASKTRVRPEALDAFLHRRTRQR